MTSDVKNILVEESLTLWNARMAPQNTRIYFYCLNFFHAPLNVAISVKYFVSTCLRIYINYTDGGSKPTRGWVIFFQTTFKMYRKLNRLSLDVTQSTIRNIVT
jgi:hypothetical protein